MAPRYRTAEPPNRRAVRARRAEGKHELELVMRRQLQAALYPTPVYCNF